VGILNQIDIASTSAPVVLRDNTHHGNAILQTGVSAAWLTAVISVVRQHSLEWVGRSQGCRRGRFGILLYGGLAGHLKSNKLQPHGFFVPRRNLVCYFRAETEVWSSVQSLPGKTQHSQYKWSIFNLKIQNLKCCKI
jgi:hypothetical protein